MYCVWAYPESILSTQSLVILSQPMIIISDDSDSVITRLGSGRGRLGVTIIIKFAA